MGSKPWQQPVMAPSEVVVLEARAVLEDRPDQVGMQASAGRPVQGVRLAEQARLVQAEWLVQEVWQGWEVRLGKAVLAEHHL